MYRRHQKQFYVHAILFIYISLHPTCISIQFTKQPWLKIFILESKYSLSFLLSTKESSLIGKRKGTNKESGLMDMDKHREEIIKDWTDEEECHERIEWSSLYVFSK